MNQASAYINYMHGCTANKKLYRGSIRPTISPNRFILSVKLWFCTLCSSIIATFFIHIFNLSISSFSLGNSLPCSSFQDCHLPSKLRPWTLALTTSRVEQHNIHAVSCITFHRQFLWRSEGSLAWVALCRRWYNCAVFTHISRAVRAHFLSTPLCDTWNLAKHVY